MGKAFVTEFAGVGAGHGDRYAIPAARDPLASHQINIGSGSTQSDPFEGATTLVRVFAESDCIVAIGVDPNAETGHQIALGAGQTDYFTVTGGHRIAVVQRAVE